MTTLSVLVRLSLLLVVLIGAIWLIAVHGVRGIVILVVLAVFTAGPRTSGWRTTEQFLVRVTGSRRRAAALVLVMVIAVMSAVSLTELMR